MRAEPCLLWRAEPSPWFPVQLLLPKISPTCPSETKKGIKCYGGEKDKPEIITYDAHHTTLDKDNAKVASSGGC